MVGDLHPSVTAKSMKVAKLNAFAAPNRFDFIIDLMLSGHLLLLQRSNHVAWATYRLLFPKSP